MSVAANIFSNMIIFAVPLLLVALGGMFSERSGTINIALEGIMVIGALFGALVLKWIYQKDFMPDSPQLAMLIAILVSGLSGSLFSWLLAFAAIRLKADQTIGGTALNMLAPAFAVVLTWAIQGQGQTVISVPTAWIKLTPESFGFTSSPNPGFFEIVFFKYFYLTTIVAILVLILSWVILYKTKIGLRIRSCGEHPHAADSVGINVYKIRYLGVMISGMLAGIGGLAFTIAAGAGFQSNVAGYGFLALAVMIFGNWKPWRIFGASLFFAFFRSIAGMSGTLSDTFSFIPRMPIYVYLMLPYVVTMIVLAFTSKKSHAPKAEGIPYDPSQR
ncbi:MAG: ABC transporter permease [Bacilli bacterium]|nr:ABC transporter permease [Bacilli bacterium]